MTDFLHRPQATADAVASGRVSAVNVVDEMLKRAETSSLNAFIFLDAETARAEARAVDERRDRGEALGPLAGVPVAVKDNLCTRNLPTTAGSKILEGYRPPYDATVVARLRRAGAVVFGKTNLDEFAMGSSNENSAYGPVLNPRDPRRVPGGSSGGSAAAVGGDLVGLSLGSDTGGSIRQPASFCGVMGLKPTYGRVSRYGLIAFASSLDQIGGFSRDAAGMALLYRAIAGHDPRDSTSSTREVDAVTPDGGVRGLRVGLAEELLSGEGVQPAVAEATRAAARALETAGAEVTPVSLPDPTIGISVYYLLATAEASSNLARFDGVRYGRREAGARLEDMYRNTRSHGFGAEVKRRIMLGTYALSAGYYDAYYLKAQKARVYLRERFAELYRSVDMILLPTTPTTAFALGEKVDDPLSMYLADVFTVFANLTGMPGISVPAGTDDDGLPVGVQLLAPRWQEDRLFRGAGVLEKAFPVPAPSGGAS